MPIPMGSSAYSIPVMGDAGEFDSLAEPFHTSLKQFPDGGFGTGGSLHTIEKGERSPSLGHDAEDATITHPRGTGKPAIYAGSEGGKHPDHDANFESHLSSIKEATIAGRPVSLREGVLGRAKTYRTENLPSKDASDDLSVDFNGYSEKEERDQRNDEAYKEFKKSPLPEVHGPQTKKATLRGEQQNEHDMNDSVADDKRFTESLHARKGDGRFILSSGKTKNSRRKT